MSPRRYSLIFLWAAPLLFLAIFYFYPLGSIFQASFARSRGMLTPFFEIARQPALSAVILFTAWQALLSMLITLAVGLPVAYLFARFEFRGKKLMHALMGIPFVMPTLVVAAGFYALLGPNGWVNLALMRLLHLESHPLQFANTLTAILVAHVFYNTTIVIRSVGDFWSRVDPNIEHAARILGANRWQALLRVTLPVLMPAISSAALLVFLFDFTSFGVVLILGGPKYSTLEVEIYRQTVSLFNLPLAAALSIIQLGCTFVLTAIYARLAARVSIPLPLRSRQITLRRLATRRQRAWATLMLAGLLLLFTLPLAALAGRSVTRPEAGTGQPKSTGLTLEYYQELSINRRNALFFKPPLVAVGVSMSYAAITVALSLALGLPAAWALASNNQAILNRLIEPLLMLPLGTSAVTLGLGFIIALDTPPLDLRASPVFIPLAHTLVAFPFVVRSLTPALRSIRPQLRHAAASLGATPWQVFRLVDLPIIGRGVVVAAIFAFTISLGEFGATSLLARPEYPTLPVVIYRYLSQPGALNYGQAMALSTILMVVTAGGMFALEHFRIADTGEF